MAIAFVQVAENRAFGPGPNPMTCPVTAIGAGHAVAGIAVCDDNGAGTFTSVTDNTSANTYVILDQGVQNGVKRSITFACGNIANGASTILVNTNASIGNWEIVVNEYSGTLASANPVDNSGATHVSQVQPTPGTGANGQTSTALTPVSNGCMIVGLTANLNAASLVSTAGTGFTGRPVNSNGFGAFTEDQPQTTATSIAATFTASASVEMFTAMIALAPLGGGGGPTDDRAFQTGAAVSTVLF